MPADTTLDVNESTTMKVIAKFQNETDVTGNANGETQSIEVKINAEQDDGEGGMVVTEPKFTGTIYRYNGNYLAIGDSIVPVSVTKWVITNGEMDAPVRPYETQNECETDSSEFDLPAGYSCQPRIVTTEGIGEYTTDASTLNKEFYLKNDVVDDIITASYACFVYNNAEHCMKGADDGASFATNTQIIKDYQTFNHLSDDRCEFSSDVSRCDGGGGVIPISASSDGNVHAYYCSVAIDGGSRCQ